MLTKLKSSVLLVLGLITSVVVALFFREKAKTEAMEKAQLKQAADSAKLSKDVSDRANAAIIEGVIKGKEHEDNIRNTPVRTDYFDNDGL